MTLTLTTDQARKSWRELIEKAFYQKAEVVIRRYNQPAAVLINYDVWMMLKNQRREYLEKLAAEAHNGDYVTQEELDKGLKERGLV